MSGGDGDESRCNAIVMRLRAIRRDDADLLLRLHSDEEVARVMPRALLPDLEAAEAMAQRILERNATGTHRGWVIEADGEAIGVVGLVRIDHAARRSELAYDVLRTHWGRGVAREAVAAALAIAFGELALEVVEAHVDAENVRSARFAEKLGFTRERSVEETINGSPRTTHIYIKRP